MATVRLSIDPEAKRRLASQEGSPPKAQGGGWRSDACSA